MQILPASKYAFVLIACTLFLCYATAGIAQVDLRRGLIGCYPFNGNANDLSTQANHGKISGAISTTDRFGTSSAAFDFDGVDDFIEIGAGQLQLNVFTYSIWVQPTYVPAYGQAVFFFSVGSDYGDQHILLGDHYSDERHTGFSHGSYLGVADNVLCTEPSTPVLGPWYHLVLVKTDTKYEFYINNKLVCSNSVSGKKAFYGTSVVRATIGARNNYGQAAKSKIDDLHIYDRALNREEIEALYNGIPSEEPEKLAIVTNSSKICAGEQATFRLTPPAKDAKVTWYVDDVAYPGFESDEFMFTTAKDSSYTFNLTAEVVYPESCFPKTPVAAKKEFKTTGCTAPVDVSRQMFVPTIFTPNGDGKNDTWNITNATDYEDFEVMVYNRWGEVVHRAKGNLTSSWDGIYRAVLVPSGVYAFKIIAGNHLIKAGSVTIVY